MAFDLYHVRVSLFEIICKQEKRKRIAGLTVGIFKSESNHTSHWHFVLEEMSWLANDFAQV